MRIHFYRRIVYISLHPQMPVDLFIQEIFLIKKERGTSQYKDVLSKYWDFYYKNKIVLSL